MGPSQENPPVAPAPFASTDPVQVRPTAELSASLPVQPAPSPPVPARRTSASVDLPDGRTVHLRRATGIDLRNANRITGGDDAIIGMALAASVSSVNGKPVIFDDFLAMDLADIQKVIKEYQDLMGN